MAGIIAEGAITLSMACSGGLLCADWLNFTRPSCGHVGHGGVIPLNSSGLRPRFCFGGPLPGDFRWGTLIADNQEQHTKTRKMVE